MGVSKGVRTLRRIDDGRYTLGRGRFSGNRKVIPINAWAEDFQIIFRKSNLLTSDIYNDWLLLGNLVVNFDRAPSQSWRFSRPSPARRRNPTAWR